MNFVKSSTTFTPTAPQQASSVPADTEPVSMDTERYGMGAKMLLAMGYTPGTGLGAHAEGITAPIETQARPQGMGLGASIATETVPEGHNSMSDRLLQQVYALVEELQLKDVQVPAVSRTNLDAVHSKLSYANTAIDDIDRQMKQLYYINRQLEQKAAENRKQILQVEELAEAMKLGDMERVVAVAENKNTARTFVNCVSEQFRVCIKQRDTEKLVALSKMYQRVMAGQHEEYEDAMDVDNEVGQEFEVSELNPFDSVIYKEIKASLTTNPGENVELLSYWYSHRILTNHFTLTYLVRKELVPQVASDIDKWVPLENSPLYLIEYLRISNEFSGLVKQVYRKILSFMSSGAAISQVAANLETLQIWKQVFEQYNHDFGKINEVLFAAVLQSDFTNVSDSLYAVVTSSFMDAAQAEMVLQFKILNPKAMELLRLKSHDLQQFLLQFKQWFDTAKKVVKAYPSLTNIYNWYTNRILQPQEEDTEFPQNLPTLNSKLVPTNDDILQYFSRLSVQGIPTTGLSTSFVDIMERFCMDHNIVVTKKQQEYEFNHKVRGIIKDDILYVKIDGQYQDIDLPALAGLV